MGNNVREAAVEVLVQVEKQGAYSNLLINSTIGKKSLFFLRCEPPN